MDEDTSIPEVAMTSIDFYVHESCGQCTPCREGLRKIKQILQNMFDGKGSKEDIDMILQLTETIKGMTLCPLGDAGAIVIKTMIEKFRDEFESLIN